MAMSAVKGGRVASERGRGAGGGGVGGGGVGGGGVGGGGGPAPSHWLFPFGHGLSYTAFEYAGLTLSSTSLESGASLDLSLTLRNSGAVSGAEVVQVYVRPLGSSVHRPDRELRAFAKQHLAPSEQATLRFTLPPRAFAYYDTIASDWHATRQHIGLQPPSHRVAASIA